MTLTLNGRADLVEPAARLLASAIDTGDGGTAEQRRVLELVVHVVWDRPDLELASLDPLGIDEARILRPDPVVRRRVRMFLVLLELCRHPLTAAQVERTDAFAAAIGDDDDIGLVMAREMVERSRAEAAEHFFLAWSAASVQLSEPLLVERFRRIGIIDPELATMLHSMVELPRGTLGREYVEFYMEHKFRFPGEGGVDPAFFVAHDMTHLIGGFGASAVDEVSLSALQLAMSDSDAHWMIFLASMAGYEAGLIAGKTDFVPKEAIMAREGAAESIFEGFARGSQCSGDFSIADHLSMVHLPIAQIREMYSVPAPTVPFPEFID